MKGLIVLTRVSVLLLALGIGAPALARDFNSDTIRDRIEDLNVQLADLETEEYSDEAAGEFAQARMEITEIQTLLGNGEVARAQVELQRLESRVALINSIIDRAIVEQLAVERETELFEMQAEADALQIELESTRQQSESLRAEVQEVIDAVEGNE